MGTSHFALRTSSRTSIYSSSSAYGRGTLPWPHHKTVSSCETQHKNACRRSAPLSADNADDEVGGTTVLDSFTDNWCWPCLVYEGILLTRAVGSYPSLFTSER